MLDLLLPVDLTTTAHRRGALEQALRSAIRTGRLAYGEPLPSSRSLAEDLGLARSTVVAAYEQLVAEGYLTARAGSATIVAHVTTTGPAIGEIELGLPAVDHDFRPGAPDPSSFPRAAWQRSLRRVITESPDSVFGYPDPRGVDELRTALAGHVGRTRSVHADPTALHVFSGFSTALGFIAESLKRRGVDRIAIEDPSLTFHGHIIRLVGVATVPIPVDSEGIDIERLRAADVGAVLVTPAHQYPTGTTMSPARRGELVAWASEHDTVIIEDDYDGEFRYDRRPIGSLQGLAPDRVIYAGTASKSLSPGLCLSWLVVPEQLRRDLISVSAARSRVSAIEQLALADYIERGDFDRHVRHMRARYDQRRQSLAAVLAANADWLRLTDTSAGLHLAATITRTDLDEVVVIDAAERASVGLTGFRTHHRTKAVAPGFAIGFSRPAQHHFPTALERLGEVLRAF